MISFLKPYLMEFATGPDFVMHSASKPASARDNAWGTQLTFSKKYLSH